MKKLLITLVFLCGLTTLAEAKKCPKKCPKKKRCRKRCKPRCCPKRKRAREQVVQEICCPTVSCENKVTEVPVTRYDIVEVEGTKTVPRIQKVCKQVPITIYKTVCEEKIVHDTVPNYTYKAVPRNEVECITTTDEICGENCREVCKKVCRELPDEIPCP